MAKIVLSSLMKMYLSDLNKRIDFITEFNDVVGGYDSNTFGRNEKNNNSEYVYHIHYIPSSHEVEKLKTWNENFANKRPIFNRTSDNIIFYTKNKTGDYLVLAFMSPGHTIFQNIDALQKLEKKASNFYHFGTIP
jgi:hypothetical protein